MLPAVLFLMVIDTVTGFNVVEEAVHVFENNDTLFGRDIIHTRDGIQVASPSSGNYLRCNLKDGCSVRPIKETKPKGLRPIQSISSKPAHQPGVKEDTLVCQQVRTKRSSQEYLNGQCQYGDEGIDPAQEAIAVINSSLNSNNHNNNHHHQQQQHSNNNYSDENEDNQVSVVTNSSPNNNNNNNNNKYPNNKNHNNNNNNNGSDDDDDDDEDPGKEIVFVLDGSGSIKENDFVKAKEFIVNVMENVWSKCFLCNFGVVQFGKQVRTELLLSENNDTAKALEKIKAIKQINFTTATASAINHVLEHVYVEQNGSKNNSEKFIIVLTDGDIFMDEMKLEDVLAKPKMKGITRFAIGVGDKVLKMPKFIKEMEAIASQQNYFFGVDNYDALTNILAGIAEAIGIEGTSQGVGFQFQLSEAGFSSHITSDQTLLFGAVGAFDWSGGLIVKSLEAKTTQFVNITNSQPKENMSAATLQEQRFSYLGYSVDSALVSDDTWYITGAPRYNLTGGVFIFSAKNHELKQRLPGDQVGSYFGSVLCALSINKNSDKAEFLLVGAPFFHKRGEEGKVRIYKLHQHGFVDENFEWTGSPSHAFARFGSAIANIGDIDGNDFNDVAVGAPLEGEDGEVCGSVYIYNGYSEGLRKHYSQRLSAADMGMKLRFFGQSVSAMAEPSPNRQELISVGSEGKVVVLRTLPVIFIEPQITLKPDKIPQNVVNSYEPLRIDLIICLTKQRGDISGSGLPIEYSIDLDPGQTKRRLGFLDGKSSKEGSFNLKDNDECIPPIELKYLDCSESDCYSAILVKLSYRLQKNTTSHVLDSFTPTLVTKEVPIEKECLQDLCPANITLSNSKLSKSKIILRSTQEFGITFNLRNTGYGSYKTTLTLIYPNFLLFFKISEKPEGSSCYKPEIQEKFTKLKCNLCHPIWRKSQATMSLLWQLEDTISNDNTATVNATLANENSGHLILDRKMFSFGIENALNVWLEGKADPSSLNNMDESAIEELQVKFQPQGDNRHNVPLNFTFSIEPSLTYTKVLLLNVSPKSACSFKTQVQLKDKHIILCSQTELKEIILKMEVHISKEQKEDEKIMVRGELGFDHTTFVSLEKDLLNREVNVLIRKLTVVKSMPAIIGGSTGGFIFLAIIIVILIKCGFFKRRHKVEQKQT